MRTRGSTLVGRKTRLIHRPYTSKDFRPRPSERLPHRQQAHTVPASLRMIRTYSPASPMYLYVPYHSRDEGKSQLFCGSWLVARGSWLAAPYVAPLQKKGLSLGDSPFFMAMVFTSCEQLTTNHWYLIIACRIFRRRPGGAGLFAGPLRRGSCRCRQRVQPGGLRRVFPPIWHGLRRCPPVFPKPA